MKKFILHLVLFFVGFFVANEVACRWMGCTSVIDTMSSWVFQDSGTLVSLVDENPKLTEKQQRIFNRIKSLPHTISLNIVKVDLEATKKDQLIVHVDKDTKIIMCDWKRTEVGSISWKNGANMAILSINNDNMMGIIMNSGVVYAIEPLGDGLHVVVKIDQTKFPRDR